MRLRSCFIKQRLFVAATVLAFGALGCEELPQSAIRGYRLSYSPNVAADRLQGSWSTPCTGASPASKSQLVFVGRQLSQVTLWFDGAPSDSAPTSCDGLPQKYNLTLGKDFTLPDDENLSAQTLNTVVRLATMSVSAAYDAAANAESLCGLQGWTDATAVDVLNQTCRGVNVPLLGSSDTPVSEPLVFVDASTITFNGITYTKDP